MQNDTPDNWNEGYFIDIFNEASEYINTDSKIKLKDRRKKVNG